MTLERTPRQAMCLVVVEVKVGVCLVRVGARRLVARQAEFERAAAIELRYGGRAVARLDHALGEAELDARGARVVVAGVDDRLEELVVVERSDELVLFVHRALAVLVRPRVELLVEGALETERGRRAGRDDVRRLAVPVRIRGRVEHEDVEGPERL